MKSRRRTVHLVLALLIGGALFQVAPGSAMSSDSREETRISGQPLQPLPGARKQLEDLHLRVVAHAKADEDEADETSAVQRKGISPEQAAELAVRSQGRGRVRFIELQNRNGRTAYHVQVDQSDHFVDAVTGGVTKGDER